MPTQRTLNKVNNIISFGYSKRGPGVVAHIYNSSYSEDEDQADHHLRPACAKVSETPFQQASHAGGIGRRMVVLRIAPGKT
jgi:hypothetical protein